ncbi:phosphodiester glycosidase family protein [Aquimarina algicola]|uniref:Phosphodiester glycosidase domain-containing protein n=1 Tax=Aquimarina algicola TaxID=2589995 RepID=A0A504JE49_9FLAO|nr:phosphodiester glycosidase family protein [Aquimarina algicola]TPN86922.1 hypothetical protein FHK87_04785 [Aquimarina algicola]
MKKFILILTLFIVTEFISAYTTQNYTVDESKFVIHKMNPQKGKLKLYWKDPKGKIFGSLGSLKKSLESNDEILVFAMNGGMYNKDQSPQGLCILKGKTIAKIDRNTKGYGNFYLQPNGIFHIDKDGKALITQTTNFKTNSNIDYATQSGPMLLINGAYHPKLTKGSANLHIRNGVGILPTGEVLFAMSKEKINFFDLATLFKQNGCINALYLDGFVSKTYLPVSNWIQLDGKFGVIIAETK